MEAPGKTDGELVAIALQDRNAFAAVIERYEHALSRYVRRMGADPESAKDIVQECFIKVYVNLNDFDEAFSFSSWLYRIAHNETVNYFRKQSVRPQPFQREEDLILFDKIPAELDIAAAFDTESKKDSVQKVLRMLENPYREVILLRFFEEKSYDEISDILRIPPGTVGTYISRGKMRLKELLKKERVLDE